MLGGAALTGAQPNESQRERKLTQMTSAFWAMSDARRSEGRTGGLGVENTTLEQGHQSRERHRVDER